MICSLQTSLTNILVLVSKINRMALFVEGQAEQIFVREMLLRRYEYNADEVCICCLKLVAERLEASEYDYGNSEAPCKFLIINAGNDNKVLSAMLRRRKRLVDEGYMLILGLRDMYCRLYRELSPQIVDPKLNQSIISAARQQIEDANVTEVKIDFAIMEVETWMLALLDKWRGSLSDKDVLKFFNPQDPVEDIYHPAEVVKDITGITGVPYDKHSSQVNAIMSGIEWQDYCALYYSNRCPSFNAFLDDLKIV